VVEGKVNEVNAVQVGWWEGQVFMKCHEASTGADITEKTRGQVAYKLLMIRLIKDYRACENTYR
jgi:hypothetical protein